MKEVKKRDLRIFRKSFLRKRLTYIFDFIRGMESGVYDKLLEVTKAKKLDEIKKKKIDNKILLPGKNIPLEWWYFTGHLNSEDKKFGFEYCIFKMHPQILRLGFIPLSFVRKKPFLVFHSSITDKTGKKFSFHQDTGMIHEDKINYKKLKLKLNDAELDYDGKFHLKSENFNLEVTPKKELIKHFDKGFKIMYPNYRTYYVTFPRAEVKGKIKNKNKNYDVNGFCWFDHQKSNVPEKGNLLGWDWFGIMLDDNTEIMLFMLRSRRGLEKYKVGGSYINKKSDIIKLGPKDVNVNHTDIWKSPETGIVYPSGWLLEIPKLKIKLKIVPVIKNQEISSVLTTPKSYWEGACDVSGIKKGKKIKGNSYVELVGYDNRIISEIIGKSMS